MSTTITPNMNLPVPIVGVEVGPQWASDLNVCLTAIDSHNHTSGSGVLITPAALNINADLTFNSNNAIALRTSRYSSQPASLSTASDRACLYVVGNELYYNDGAGNVVPITSSGSVNAGSGSITGLPSGTAGVTYSSGTYTFNSATSTRAIMDVGSVIIRNLTASAFGVTLTASASLSANYPLVLPLVPVTAPNTYKFLNIDTAGNIYSNGDVDNTTLAFASGTLSVKANGITASKIANNTITATQLANNIITDTQVSGHALSLASISTSSVNYGSYTPALQSSAGMVSITTNQANWLRIGSTVFVTGQFVGLPPTSGNPWSIFINLPVATNVFTATFQLSGCGAGQQTQAQSFGCSAQTGSVNAFFKGTSQANVAEIYGYSFSYQIQ